LYCSTTGQYNVAVGNSCLINNTSGSNNYAFGNSCLTQNTTGGRNYAFGSQCLTNNTTGINNCAFGNGSLSNNNIGYNNIGIGTYAIQYGSTGNNNIGIGNSALSNAGNSINNIAIGLSAGIYITSGINNTFLGSNTNSSIQSKNSTALGYGANITQSNQIVLGTNAETTYIPGGLIVQGTAQFNNNIGITGNLYINNNLLFGGTSIFQNSVGITGNLFLNNNLLVGGTSQFQNSVGITGNLFLNNILTVGGTAIFSKYVGFSNNVGITGNITVNNNLTVSGTANFQNDVFVIGTVNATEFYSSSDIRIKKDVVNIKNNYALDIIRHIEPKCYNYIDKNKFNDNPTWGFIAQDIEKILPYSTKKITDFIPNIYEYCTLIDTNKISLNNKSTKDFILNNENRITCRLYLYENENKIIKDIIIEKIIDDKIFEINNVLIDTLNNNITSIFVYGQKINDFYNLDKNSIFTMSVGAIKEIDNELKNIIDRLNILENKFDYIYNLIEK
jgi:predicted acyltransferase (DUF342 family)